MMANGVKQQCVPGISGIQLPVSSLLQKDLYFLFIKLQAKGKSDYFIP